MLPKLLSSAVILGSSVGGVVVSEEEFHAWATRHGKVYSSPFHRSRARQAWEDNAHTVNVLNSRNLSWVATLENQFGDMTPAEFAKNILTGPFHVGSDDVGRRSKSTGDSTSKHRGKKYALRHALNTEDEFDWTEHGAVTDVHDQGSVGTCWAFSTIANVEGQWFLSTGELVDMSEEYLVDCDGSRDDEANRADCGVFGGWPYLAYQFIIDSGGVPTEETVPYCCGMGDCYPCMNGPVQLCGPPPYYCDDTINDACPNISLYAHISGWKYVSSDEGVMKEDLVDVGPLSALLDASQLQFYESGVWSGGQYGPTAAECSKQYLNHAVLITGYGGGSSSPYWTVKNSWGTGWGENGYFRIVRGEGTCGINTEVTTSIV